MCILLVALDGWVCVGFCRICEWPIDSLLHGLEADKWDVDYIREGSFPFEVRFGKCDVSVTNSAYVFDWERFVVVFVVPVFIPFSYFVLYDCSLGSSRYRYHDWFMWGSYALVLYPGKRGSFLAMPFCVREMWFGDECVPWFKGVTRWVVSFFVRWNWFFRLLF